MSWLMCGLTCGRRDRISKPAALLLLQALFRNMLAEGKPCRTTRSWLDCSAPKVFVHAVQAGHYDPTVRGCTRMLSRIVEMIERGALIQMKLQTRHSASTERFSRTASLGCSSFGDDTKVSGLGFSTAREEWCVTSSPLPKWVNLACLAAACAGVSCCFRVVQLEWWFRGLGQIPGVEAAFNFLLWVKSRGRGGMVLVKLVHDLSTRFYLRRGLRWA